MEIIQGGLLITALVVSYMSALLTACWVSSKAFLDGLISCNTAAYVLSSLALTGVFGTVVTYLWSLTGVFG